MRPLPVLALVVAALVVTAATGCADACGHYNAGYIRGGNIRSMLTIEEVALALEQYRQEHGSYPMVTSMAGLQQSLGPLLNKGP